MNSGSAYLLIGISIFGILQGLIVAGILYFNPGRERATSNWLALFIFSLVLVLIAPGFQYFIPWQFLILFHSIKYIAIASLYLYIKSLSQEITFNRALKHLIIAPLYLPVAWLHLSYLINTYGLEAFYEGIIDPYDSIIKVFNLIYLVFYLILNVKAWKDHKGKVENNMSRMEDTGIRWIGQLIAGYVVIIIISYTSVGLMYTDAGNALLYCMINIASITAFIYFVTIKGKITPEIYTLKRIEKDLKQNIGDNRSDNDQFNIDDTLRHLAEKIKDLFEQEQVYKEENLSIKDLADKLKTPAYMISQAINQVMDKTFFELVNEYRVNEVKKMMSDPTMDHYSLLGIGLGAGFSSKTTFNTVFKKMTGMTPSEYKKQATSSL